MGEHVAEKLADLGLSNYEAQAFQALIQRGPMTADEVAAAADLPKGRIYDVLNSLSKRSIVRHDDSRPRTYVPASPEHAVSQLLDARLEDLDERRRRFEATAEELETAIRSQEPDRPTQSFATSAFRHEDAIELLDERLGTASDCVCIAAGSINEGPETRDTLADRLEALLADGVEIKLLVHDDIDLEFETGLVDAGLTVRCSPVVPDQRFILIDRDEVCLEVVHPVETNELMSVVDFRSDKVASELATTFDELWADATPIEP